MTPYFLQEALAEEIPLMFEQYRARTPSCTLGKLNVYKQDLPIQENADEEDQFPFVLIVILGGSGDIQSGDVVQVNFIVGCYDDNPQQPSYVDVLHILQMIKARFAKDPLLAGQFVASDKVKWELEGDVYPYYYGGMEMEFTVPAIVREDPYI